MQLWDFIFNHRIHLYFLFGVFIWSIWLTKIILASRYKPIESDFKATTSVIVPIYKEKPEVLRRCLSSILKNHPDEVIACVDYRDPLCERIAREFEPRVRVEIIPVKGKRQALAMGIEKAKSEIVVLADCDTIWTKGVLKNLLEPFKDVKVGGVCARNVVFEPINTVRRLANWLEDLRFKIAFPAQSVCRVTAVLSGRTSAYRREYVLPMLPELVNETFLGKPCVSGDDGRLTYLTLKAGYETVYQSSALVYTDVPTVKGSEFRGFLKQRIRWWRNSSRRITRGIYEGWIFRRSPMLAFSMISNLISPLFLSIVLLEAAYRAFWAGEIVPPELLRLGIFLLGITITRGIRSFPHLSDKKSDLLLLPLYALMAILLLFPVRLYSFFTMNVQGWLTRTDPKFFPH